MERSEKISGAVRRVESGVSPGRSAEKLDARDGDLIPGGVTTAPAKPSSKRFNFFDAAEKPTEWLVRLCGWSSIIGIVAIFLFIFKEAAPVLPKTDWIYFFTSPRWIPNPGAGNEPSFGALALLVGTLSTTFTCLIIAVPVG